jgi:hypothetical protein
VLDVEKRAWVRTADKLAAHYNMLANVPVEW